MNSNHRENRVPLIVVLASVIALAYFYLLDRIGFSSSHFSPIFKFLLVVYDNHAAWAAVGISILACVWRYPEPVERLCAGCGRHPVLFGMVMIVLLAAGATLIYRAYPLSMDEYAAVFQGKAFATGHLVARVPPELVEWLVVPGFNGMFLIASATSGQIIEAYWPGFSALLAPFQWVGAPWLCNPVLSAIGLWAIFRTTLALTGDRTAGGWAMLFAIASGAFFITGISFYSMQAHLVANVLFVWLLSAPTVMRAMLAGLLGSFALVLHNPFPHAVFAAPWIVGLLLDTRQRRFAGWLGLGYLPLLIGIGGGWGWLRADLLHEAGLTTSLSSALSGSFRWPTADIFNMRAAALVKMSVWAVPGLLVFAAIGARQRWADRRVRLMVASTALTFMAYLFVSFDQGHGWGYRYFHPAWGMLPILAACAMLRQQGRAAPWAGFAGASVVLSFLVMLPLQLSQVKEFIDFHLDPVSHPRRPGNNVYFVDPFGGFYTSDLIQFDPQLCDPDLILISHGQEQNARLVKANWPHARRVGGGYWGEQWYLGATDVRQPDALAGGNLAFQIRVPR